MSFRRGARLALVAGLAAGGLTLTACTPGSLGSNTATGGSGSAAASVTITYLVDNSDQAVKPATTLVEAFNAANPGITVKLETRAQARTATTSSRPSSPPATWPRSSATTPDR